jgi:hypothetical protein
MYTIQKTRQSHGIYYVLIPLVILAVTALLEVILEMRVAFTFLATIFWVYAAYSFITLLLTQNMSFLVVVLFQIFVGFQEYMIPLMMNNPQMRAVMIFLVACNIIFMVWVFALSISKKLKWRGREILELAAAPVDDIGNGYTPRPLPAGKTEFTQRQVAEFGRFTRRNLLAITYLGKDKIVFVPVVAGRETPFILGLKGDYTDETWVAIDSSGNVSVNISHRDYMEYKESYAFDQLCASLANLFVEFIAMHQRGEGVRIMDRLDAVNISWYA